METPEQRAGGGWDIEVRLVFADPCVMSWQALVAALEAAAAGRPLPEILDGLAAEHTVPLDDLDEALARWGLFDEGNEE